MTSSIKKILCVLLLLVSLSGFSKNIDPDEKEKKGTGTATTKRNVTGGNTWTGG